MPELGGGTGAWSPGARVGAATSLVMDVLAREGAVWVREASSSMAPLIQPRDEVRLVAVDPGRVALGTLIAYRREDRLILHRVLDRHEAGIVGKGDALASPDPLVGWEQVVGRVTALRRAGRRPADLDAFPWPLVHNALGVIAAIACHLPVEHGAGGRFPLLPRLLWKSLRAPFYLARCLVP